MEDWTDAQWAKWDKDDLRHMQVFFDRVHLQCLMRRDVKLLRKSFTRKVTNMPTQEVEVTDPLEDREPPAIILGIMMVFCVAVMMLWALYLSYVQMGAN